MKGATKIVAIRSRSPSTVRAARMAGTSQAYAALQGRDFVTPEDIKSMAIPVLRHRIILTPEKEMEGTSPDQVIEEVINKVEVPR